MKQKLACLGLILALSGFTSPAFGCACCADPGARQIFTYDTKAYIAEDLADLRLGKTAHLYTTACDLECVEGIEQAQYEYDVTYGLNDAQVHLTFTSAAGPSGAISFALPEKVTDFAVDTAPDLRGGSPLLYKEYRMQVTATGTGAFAALTPEIQAHFILQGRGNYCTSVADFSHWNFHAKGDGVNFSFFGQLTN